LRSQPWKDFTLHEIRELRERVGFQARSNLAGKHINLPCVELALWPAIGPICTTAPFIVNFDPSALQWEAPLNEPEQSYSAPNFLTSPTAFGATIPFGTGDQVRVSSSRSEGKGIGRKMI
jgi:hypothetical protein